jgi:diguanylate cyclase (GGDEF)-like protein/PAS domain S-box-containing protein
MKDKDKTKEQLITELVELRQKITELEEMKNKNKTTEKSLLANEKRFRGLFDHMSSGVAIYEAKDNGRDFIIKDYNKAGERIEKVKKKDIIGRSVLKVFPGVKDFGLFEVFQKVYKTGKSQHHPISFYQDQRITGWRENYVYKLPSGEIVAVYDDITERKQEEETLKQSEEKLKSILNTMSDYCYIRDKDFKIKFMNKSMIEKFGNQIGKICYKTFFNRKSPCPWDKFKEIQKGETVKWEYYFPEWGGTFEIMDSPIKNKDGIILKLGIARDISEHKQTEKELTYLATHDILTGFPNRTLFDDRLTLAIAQAKRNKKKLAVMLFDLDRFKEVNDTMGHVAGDQLLKEVSKRMKNLLRKGDTIARMGGDEFLLLLPEISQIEDATKIARKIIDSFKSIFKIDHQKIHITTSIGIVAYPEDGEDSVTLIKNADIAMYQAKKEGRNNYQFYKKLI